MGERYKSPKTLSRTINLGKFRVTRTRQQVPHPGFRRTRIEGNGKDPETVRARPPLSLLPFLHSCPTPVGRVRLSRMTYVPRPSEASPPSPRTLGPQTTGTLRGRPTVVPGPQNPSSASRTTLGVCIHEVTGRDVYFVLRPLSRPSPGPPTPVRTSNFSSVPTQKTEESLRESQVGCWTDAANTETGLLTTAPVRRLGTSTSRRPPTGPEEDPLE